MATEVMYRKRICTANDLVSALLEMGKMCERNLDEILLENADILTVVEDVLTDGSKVYNFRINYVGPDQNVPF